MSDRVLTPGIHDLAAADYYSDSIIDLPTLNATVCKLLINASPRHAFTAHPKLNPSYAPSADKKFDVGSAAHELFLLNDDARVAVVDAADWRTSAAKAVRDQAREEGMLPLLAHQWAEVHSMLEALRVQLPGLEADPPLFVGGKPERTIVWEDEFGVICRARLDYLHDDFSACDDIKTCAGSASPLRWASRTLFGIHAEIQAALTIRGIKKLTGVTPDFRFLAVETHPPHGISAVRLGPAAIEMANHQIERAMLKWKRCLESGVWPSYPPVIVDAEPPGWHAAEIWATEQLDDAAAAA